MVSGKSWAEGRVRVDVPELLPAWSSGESPRIQLRARHCHFDGAHWSPAWLGSQCESVELGRGGCCKHSQGPHLPLASGQRPGKRQSKMGTKGGGHPRRGQQPGGPGVVWQGREVVSSTVRPCGERPG